MRHFHDDQRLLVVEVRHKRKRILESIEWVSDGLFPRKELLNIVVIFYRVIPNEMLLDCLLKLLLLHCLEKVLSHRLSEFVVQTGFLNCKVDHFLSDRIVVSHFLKLDNGNNICAIFRLIK